MLMVKASAVQCAQAICDVRFWPESGLVAL